MDKLEAEKVLKVETKEMFDRHCPDIRSNCNKRCVHYKAGSVCAIAGDGCIVLSPACRLWRY